MYKDERDHVKAVRVATSAGSLAGPYVDAGRAPVTPPWTEGPEAFAAGDLPDAARAGLPPHAWLLYADCYTVGAWCVRVADVADLRHWRKLPDGDCDPRAERDGGAGALAVPPGARHGGFLRISAAELAALRAAFDPPGDDDGAKRPRGDHPTDPFDATA